MHASTLHLYTLTLHLYTPTLHVFLAMPILILQGNLYVVTAQGPFYQVNIMTTFKSYHCPHFPLKKICLFHFNKALCVKWRVNYWILSTQEINITYKLILPLGSCPELGRASTLPDWLRMVLVSGVKARHFVISTRDGSCKGGKGNIRISWGRSTPSPAETGHPDKHINTWIRWNI